MKKSIKAALLSALVFPGVGHFFLKRKKTGAILVALSVFGFYYLTSKILEMTTLIFESAQRTAQASNAQPDVAVLRELVLAELASPNNQFISLVMSLLMLVWFVGIVDAYRVGLAADKQADGQA